MGSFLFYWISVLDFHSHLMPAVDDGACNLDESREGLEAFRTHGVTTVITTPHLRGSMTTNPAELALFLGVLDEAWEQLQSQEMHGVQ